MSPDLEVKLVLLVLEVCPAMRVALDNQARKVTKVIRDLLADLDLMEYLANVEKWVPREPLD